MLRVFLYEHTCACDSAALKLPASMQTEGWAMLTALLDDFSRIADVEICTLLDNRRRASVENEAARVIRTDNEPEDFRKLAQVSDYTLVIAPEIDHILYSRCKTVEQVGGRLLGPSANAVLLTGDKLECGRHLQRAGIPTPACISYGAGNQSDRLDLPAVRKPRYGAGSHSTRLIHDLRDLDECATLSAGAGHQEEHILQPHIPGRPVSVAFIVSQNEHVPLPPASQHLSDDGRFRYLGGAIPIAEVLGQRAIRLASRGVETIPGTLGYVGVDLVLGDEVNGRGDWVIEINPRLTTSYIGLRAMTQTNLAEAMLRAAMGHRFAAPSWLEGSVRFHPDGRCTRKNK